MVVYIEQEQHHNVRQLSRFIETEHQHRELSFDYLIVGECSLIVYILRTAYQRIAVGILIEKRSVLGNSFSLYPFLYASDNGDVLGIGLIAPRSLDGDYRYAQHHYKHKERTFYYRYPDYKLVTLGGRLFCQFFKLVIFFHRFSPCSFF